MYFMGGGEEEKIRECTFGIHKKKRSPHTTPSDTHANLSRLKAILSRLIQKSAGNYPAKRAKITGLEMGDYY